MFWILCAALVVVVSVAILAPVWRGQRSVAEPAAAFDLQVYRDQLREVDRDLERGVIGAEDGERLRAEIGRKVLDADRRMADAPLSAMSGGRLRGIIATMVVVVIGAGSVALYLREGVPGAPDQPMADRIAGAERAYDARPSQEEAEKAVPPRPAPPEIDPQYAILVDELRAAVADHPDDAQGLTLLADNETRLGNITAAREAQQRLVDLRGPDASAQETMRLAALMMEAAGGLITPEAETMLARSLRTDPNQPQARYLLGLMQLQNGRPDRAFPVWQRLLEESAPDAPWFAPIRAAITDLAWLAGQPDYVPPEPAMAMALPGPDADAMAAAEGMSDGDRGDMIATMVAGLEARLARQGGSPEEWARLISSLVVIDRIDHAREIWTEARSRFAVTPEALAIVQAAAQRSGLTE